MTTTHAVIPAAALAGAVRRYGAVRAVDALDLTIHRGERVALLGRNGAGKSTTVNLLLGLDRPDAGGVRLFGAAPRDAVLAGRVGAMLQDTRPAPRVTVGELAAFVARSYPRPLPVAEALDLAGLTGLARRRADKLSGGQAQRLSFALALVGDPDLLVLDEPTAALDVEARRSFWSSLRTLTGRGTTVLFSTHYLDEADRNAERIVVLDRGRLVADGSGTAIKRAVGSSTVSFFVPEEGRPEGLDGLPGVVAVEDHADRIRLRTTDSDATVRALAALVRFRGLEVAPAGLEDAFLGMTSAPDAPRPDPGTPGPGNPSPTSAKDGA